MWALTHIYGSVYYTYCVSIILWRAHKKSQFILYRVDVGWMKEINLFWSNLFYVCFSKIHFLVTNIAKLEIIQRNSAKLTKVFRENMRNFDKILPRNFTEFRRNSAKKVFYFVQFRISRNNQIPISWPPYVGCQPVYVIFLRPGLCYGGCIRKGLVHIAEPSEPQDLALLHILHSAI
jgi:hypothetical protein